MMTGHGVGMKVGMMMKDGMKMIGLVQLLMTVTGTMMIGHGMSQIGVLGMMIGLGATGTSHRPLQQAAPKVQSHQVPQPLHQLQLSPLKLQQLY